MPSISRVMLARWSQLADVEASCWFNLVAAIIEIRGSGTQSIVFCWWKKGQSSSPKAIGLGGRAVFGHCLGAYIQQMGTPKHRKLEVETKLIDSDIILLKAADMTSVVSVSSFAIVFASRVENLRQHRVHDD